MEHDRYTYLKFASFKDLANWSVSHILGINLRFTNLYPMTPIRQIIKRNQQTIIIKDEVQYKQITLKTNGGGAVLRDVKLGKDIGTKKQYPVSTGQFIISKIDARNGAFGLITKDLNGAVVTADFPVFDVIGKNVVPKYLLLLSTTKTFARFAQSCSRGTTNRQRIDIELFLSKRIPLPSLKTQQILVEAYNKKIDKAKELELQAELIEHSIEEYLLEELGIMHCSFKMQDTSLSVVSEPQIELDISHRQEINMSAAYHQGNRIQEEYNYLRFVEFKDIKRWDCYNEESNILTKLKESHYPIVEIGNVYDFVQRRWDKKGSHFYYVEIGAVDPLKGILYAEDIPTNKAPSRATQKIKAGDLIIGTTRPYLKKFAIVDDKYDDCVCSSGFQVVAPNRTYNLSYLYEFLKTSVAISQFELLMSGAIYPAITNKDLKKILIPLPPISVQNTIVKHINKQKVQMMELKQMAVKLRKEALAEFEKEIFE